MFQLMPSFSHGSRVLTTLSLEYPIVSSVQGTREILPAEFLAARNSMILCILYIYIFIFLFILYIHIF